LSHGKTDAAALKPAKKFKPLEYPKPDGVISFDKLTNVSFTNTYHGEDQPVHLVVKRYIAREIYRHLAALDTL
ncbi:4Fe-4S dicluster domain-containing protein, partial [Nocardioides sp.]|uniref:4Fe-4S dicluster domain-containing protein n=1 Tax=Nocardioides sp. TaxID=35761 RepID=UPI0035132DD5